jgi:hypothetical protein
MRRSRHRFVLALVLALTIPLQALAAAGAGICGATGHHSTAEAAPHDHEAALDHEGAAGDHHAYCPPCAGCCASAAISSSELLLLPQPAIAAHIAAGPPSFTTLHPESLDRPPLAL